MPYVVYVNENSHYMDEEGRYKADEFEDWESAVAYCKRIVNRSLDECDASGTADEMFRYFTTFGEDPWISPDDGEPPFSAWEYARARCKELARG